MWIECKAAERRLPRNCGPISGREEEVSCFGAPDQRWAHSEAEQYAGKSKAREKRGRREEDVEEELRSRQVLDRWN